MTSAVNDIYEFADTYGITLMNQSQAALSEPLRDLHRAVLTAFVDTGAAPATAWLAERAAALGLDGERAVADLADADLVHTADGIVTVAYPFSGTPTPHRVWLDDGPDVWAMCGGDAIGIPLMTGRDATIASADPYNGEPIGIRYHDGNWTWQPPSTVMLVAGTTGCGSAAEAVCRYVHFFTGRATSAAYLEENPRLGGAVYDQEASVRAAEVVFGPLLGGPGG